MNLQELLSDPAREMEIELGQIDERMKLVALRNDTGTLKQLSKRKAELPELIRQAKLRDIAQRINDQRTKLGIYQADYKKANEEARTLGTEFVPKVTELNQEIERLKNENLEALAILEALRWSVAQEEEEMSKLTAKRQALLLSSLDK
jgi:hypothetical protein